MADMTTFHALVADLPHGVHGDLRTADLRVYLTNGVPTVGMATKAELAEIAAGNGYAALGASVALVSSAQVAGVYKLTLADPEPWLAAGGDIGPFRYLVLYNNTPASKPLMGWWDRGSAITVVNGDSFAPDLSAANGVFQLDIGVPV